MLEFFQTYSYIGLFLILFTEESGIPLPIPGDIFIALAAGLPNSNYFLIVTTVVISTLCGSTILFSLSRKFGHLLITKYGKYIKITPEKVTKIEKWFNKHGGRAIIICRLIPGLRIVTPIVAGTFRVSYKSFWLNTLIAALIWANIYFFIGKFFGNILQLFSNKPF